MRELVERNWNFVDFFNCLYINCVIFGDVKIDKFLGFYVFCYKRYNNLIMKNVKKCLWMCFN